jgi:hypothetical protein
MLLAAVIRVTNSVWLYLDIWLHCVSVTLLLMIMMPAAAAVDAVLVLSSMLLAALLQTAHFKLLQTLESIESSCLTVTGRSQRPTQMTHFRVSSSRSALPPLLLPLACLAGSSAIIDIKHRRTQHQHIADGHCAGDFER